MWIPSVLGLSAGAFMLSKSMWTFWQLSNRKWNWGLFLILSPCTVKLELVKNLMACNNEMRLQTNFQYFSCCGDETLGDIWMVFVAYNWAVTRTRQRPSIDSLFHWHRMSVRSFWSNRDMAMKIDGLLCEACREDPTIFLLSHRWLRLPALTFHWFCRRPAIVACCCLVAMSLARQVPW